LLFLVSFHEAYIWNKLQNVSKQHTRLQNGAKKHHTFTKVYEISKTP